LVPIHKASINRTPVYPQPALGHLFIHSRPLDGLEACAATDLSSPYSECLGCSQYVPVLPEIPHLAYSIRALRLWNSSVFLNCFTYLFTIFYR